MAADYGTAEFLDGTAAAGQTLDDDGAKYTVTYTSLNGKVYKIVPDA